MEYDVFYILFISITFSITSIVMLAACLCCRKKLPKNEFLGLEGMVKIKNPEDILTINDESVQVDLNTSNSVGDADSKRAVNAPHRSLPDIPVTEPLNDNGSELYATVADKIQEQPHGKSPTASLKKQTSVSQHSSLSQADDISSPYARVKTPLHAYDKVRPSEHPYAQLNNAGPSTSSVANPPAFHPSAITSSARRGSNQSLLEDAENQQEIPAASAIAGMVSASQELPYMTPPIVQQQPHFSGDSQDSSKGYTSISVREPLANILAQTPHPIARLMQKDGNDSHYATVSDDSDEMYAAIDDPNNQGEIYTSESETYAQIQPSNGITVSVEINTTAGRSQEPPENPRASITNKKLPNEMPIPPNVDSLKAQMHSRQASSSSNASSIANIGSPKPEKRQANSPLPPTPKNLQYLSNSNLTSSSSVPSGRNSVASVIECQVAMAQGARFVSKENVNTDETDDSGKKNFSPSKDIEGMYAKVMKKNKFSSIPSQNSSPITNPKVSTEGNLTDTSLSEHNIKHFLMSTVHSSPDKRRSAGSNYEKKDHGYETIPAGKTNLNNNLLENRKSDGYAQIIQKELNDSRAGNPGIGLNLLTENVAGYESLPEPMNNANDPGYEQLLKPATGGESKSTSDYDPNYEVLRPSLDDGYAKVLEKPLHSQDETAEGYSRVKAISDAAAGYSSINEKVGTGTEFENHDYASILEANRRLNVGKKAITNNNNEETGSDIYSSIPNEQSLPYLHIQDTIEQNNYQTIQETQNDYAKACTSASSSIPVSSNSINSVSSILDKLTTTTTTPSSDRNSPIERQMKCSSTSNTISSGQQPSSNYESLTGSESDPNYESVRYLDTENPYERLHNDSNISPDTPSTEAKHLSQINNKQKPDRAAIANSENGEVDDYFQV